MTEDLRQGFTLGEFDVRPLEGRIIGTAGSRHVPPKAMEVLICLAEHPGQLVERSTLLEHGWGNSTESDHALTKCISDLRHHLGDSHEPVRYIQTVPRRGYRLVAAVRLPGEGESPGHSESAPSEGQPSKPVSLWQDLNRRNVGRVAVAYIVIAWLSMQVGDTLFDALLLPEWTLTLLLALLVIGFPIAIVLAWIFEVTPEGVVVDKRRSLIGRPSLRRNLDVVIIGALIVAVGVLGFRSIVTTDTSVDFPEIAGVRSAAPQNSIAVLRFLNIGGESYFADGLCEELLDRLAEIRELGVAARTSSWAFSDGDADIPTIAEQLDVDYVLEGSVRQVGDRIKVTAQLNDGETGMHVWSQSYDRDLTTANFFETQSDIARHVVDLLEVTLSPESEQRLAKAPQTSLDALDFYLQGQASFREPHSDDTLNTAESYFRQSLEVDPRFAMAYAGLCDANLGRYIITRDVTVFEDAERACHRALTLDGDSPRVLAALGGLYLFSGQNEKAQDQLLRAINQNPNLIDAYADLGEALENQGKLDEAEWVFDTMVSRQPGYWYAYNALGNFLYRQSRYEEAREVWTRVVELVPNRSIGYNNVAIAHYMMGDFNDAARAYEASLAIEPYVDNYTNLGLAYFYDGQFENAARMQQKAAELRPEDARVIGRLATAYQFGGREQDARPLYVSAIELLEKQLAINPNDIRSNRFLAVYNVSIGQLEEGQAAISHALELQPKSSGVNYDAAKVALAMGDVDEALAYLEQARELGYSASIIGSDPFFISLREDARFKAVAQKHKNKTTGE